MNIILHPKIAELVKRETQRLKSNHFATKHSIAMEWSQPEADEVVNEILWLALRGGDITKHYTSTDVKLTRKT